MRSLSLISSLLFVAMAADAGQRSLVSLSPKSWRAAVGIFLKTEIGRKAFAPGAWHAITSKLGTPQGDLLISPMIEAVRKEEKTSYYGARFRSLEEFEGDDARLMEEAGKIVQSFDRDTALDLASLLRDGQEWAAAALEHEAHGDAVALSHRQQLRAAELDGYLHEAAELEQLSLVYGPKLREEAGNIRSARRAFIERAALAQAEQNDFIVDGKRRYVLLDGGSRGRPKRSRAELRLVRGDGLQLTPALPLVEATQPAPSRAASALPRVWSYKKGEAPTHIEERLFTVIQDEHAWDILWAAHRGNKQAEAPKLDFSKQFVLVMVPGPEASADEIRIEGIEQQGRRLTIRWSQADGAQHGGSYYMEALPRDLDPGAADNVQFIRAGAKSRDSGGLTFLAIGFTAALAATLFGRLRGN